MQSERPVKDFYNRIIGYIITDTVTGDKIAKDFYRRILGYYDKKQDVTRDFYQRIIARGDLLSSLISEADMKNRSKK